MIGNCYFGKDRHRFSGSAHSEYDGVLRGLFSFWLCKSFDTDMIGGSQLPAAFRKTQTSTV